MAFRIDEESTVALLDLLEMYPDPMHTFLKDVAGEFLVYLSQREGLERLDQVWSMCMDDEKLTSSIRKHSESRDLADEVLRNVRQCVARIRNENPTGDKIIGALGVFSNKNDSFFKEEAISLLTHIADQVSLVHLGDLWEVVLNEQVLLRAAQQLDVFGENEAQLLACIQGAIRRNFILLEANKIAKDPLSNSENIIRKSIQMAGLRVGP